MVKSISSGTPTPSVPNNEAAQENDVRSQPQAIQGHHAPAVPKRSENRAKQVLTKMWRSLPGTGKTTAVAGNASTPDEIRQTHLVALLEVGAKQLGGVSSNKNAILKKFASRDQSALTALATGNGDLRCMTTGLYTLRREVAPQGSNVSNAQKALSEDANQLLATVVANRNGKDITLEALGDPAPYPDLEDGLSQHELEKLAKCLDDARGLRDRARKLPMHMLQEDLESKEKSLAELKSSLDSLGNSFSNKGPASDEKEIRNLEKEIKEIKIKIFTAQHKESVESHKPNAKFENTEDGRNWGTAKRLYYAMKVNNSVTRRLDHETKVNNYLSRRSDKKKIGPLRNELNHLFGKSPSQTKRGSDAASSVNDKPLPPTPPIEKELPPRPIDKEPPLQGHDENLFSEDKEFAQYVRKAVEWSESPVSSSADVKTSTALSESASVSDSGSLLKDLNGEMDARLSVMRSMEKESPPIPTEKTSVPVADHDETPFSAEEKVQIQQAMEWARSSASSKEP